MHPHAIHACICEMRDFGSRYDNVTAGSMLNNVLSLTKLHDNAILYTMQSREGQNNIVHTASSDFAVRVAGTMHADCGLIGETFSDLYTHIHAYIYTYILEFTHSCVHLYIYARTSMHIL